MAHLNFASLVAILQENFNEDLLAHVDGDDFFPDEVLIDDPLAEAIMIRLFDNYEASASDSNKLDTFLSVLEDVRNTLNSIEYSLENYEEIVNNDEYLD